METNKQIAAVVVTFNRLTYLKKCIASLKNQTHKLDAIFVINNDSTDGTCEWLKSQHDLIVISQKNVGGSGGFYRGLKEAYDAGYEYIWAMDDDVNPTDSCLEDLLKYMSKEVGILCPRREMDGVAVITEMKSFNLKNPFKPLGKVLSNSDIKGHESIDIEGMAFEGPIISRQVIDRIGLPNKDLFILWDDTDFSYRAVKAGFKVKYISSAILNKENLTPINVSKRHYRSWKVFYNLRNTIYFLNEYAENKLYKLKIHIIFLQYLLGFIKHLALRDGYYKIKDLKLLLSSYNQGLNRKLGKL